MANNGMTIQEFSNTFDTLLNSYNTQAVFGEQSSKADVVLDEYEKSVLLTQAQDIIVKQYFDRSLNPQGQGFDDSTRRLMDFSSLVTVAAVTPDESSIPATTYDDRGIVFTLPDGVKTEEIEQPIEGSETGETEKVTITTGYPKVLVILNEKLKITNGDKSKTYVVVPINYKEYDRQMSKAYTLPLKKQCWRLFNSEGTLDLKSEIIPIASSTSSESSYEYKLRYIRRPRPIVLTDLSDDGLDIDGETAPNTDGIACELNPIIHMDVLNKAVELALSTRGGRILQPVQLSTTTGNQ